MKQFFYGVCLLASASVGAQQAPGAIFDSSGKGPQPSKQVPSATKSPNADEMAELLRAQTAAIKALSDKVDALEARLAKIEKGGR